MRTHTLRRRRYRRFQGLDLFRGLGPGDPGYRLRPGASGLDPMESYMEQGRVMGLLLVSLLGKGRQEWLVPSLFLLFAGLTFITFRLLSWSQFFIQIDPAVAVAAPAIVVILVALVVAGRRVFAGREPG